MKMSMFVFCQDLPVDISVLEEHNMFLSPEDGGRRLLRSVDIYLKVHIMIQPRTFNIPWISVTFSFPFQINTAGSMCLAVDVSSSCQCMAFGDGGGSIHFYTSNPHRAMFNSFSRETEFADPVEPLPPISILDDVTPLSSVPLPYCQPGSTLLSDWPEQYLKKVYR